MIGSKSSSTIRPLALGATVQNSSYGQTIPVIYGRTKSALYLIWAANLRKEGGGKKYKKSFGKKSPPDFNENADLLLGHNPIAGVLQFWVNQNTRLPLNFAKYSTSVPIATGFGGSTTVTIPDPNFYFILGVTITQSYSAITFNDYGGSPRTIPAGSWEVPLWNAAYTGPNPTQGFSDRYGLNYYIWVPGSGPTIDMPQNFFNGIGGTALNIYYAQLDPDGSPLYDKSHSDIDVPCAALRLTFEPVLGNGPEFSGTDHSTGAPLSEQQILYPHYAGLGSPNLDMGSTQTIPDIRPEVVGSYPLYPTGDADFADMAEDIFSMGLSQAALGSAYAYTQVQRGLGCYELPGVVQATTMMNVDFWSRPISYYRPNTAGNILIAAGNPGESTTGGFFADVTDTAGNTWTPTITPYVGADDAGQLWWAVAQAATSNAVTFHAQSTFQGYHFQYTIAEIAGVDTFDNAVTDTTGSGPALSITTTNAPGEPAFIVAFANYTADYILTTPADLPHWKLMTKQANDCVLYYRVVWQPGTYTFTPVKFNSSWPLQIALVAFKTSQPSAYPKALGNILDADSLDLCRLQCRANGLWGSMVMDSQQAASDWLTTLYAAMNAAPVWSGFKLKSIPYSEVSAAGNGAIYNAPTASGPVANLSESDFLGNANSPLVTIDRTAQVDVPNLLQIQHPNRESDYNDVTVSEPETASIALYGPRKASPQQFRCVQDVSVARMLLGIASRSQNYLRNHYKFKLSAKWKLLEPMDLVTLTDTQIGLAAVPVRLISIAEDDQFALECEAEPFIYGTYAPAPVDVTAAQPYQPPVGADPGSVNAPVLFEPLARMTTQPGQAELWCVVSGADPDYGGCQVYVSSDGGNSYLNMGLTTGNGITGVTVGSWPAAADPDTANNLTVDLTESNGELLSYQTSDEDNFVYPCYVAGGTTAIPYELMAYAVATLTATSTYRLEATGSGHKLRRAVFGAPEVGSGVAHTSGSRFAFVGAQAPGIFKLPLDPKWIGQTLHLKFCAFNQYQGALQSLSDAVDYTYVPTGIAQASNPNATNYVQTPVNALSNPTSTSLAMTQVTVQFPTNTVNYNARTFTIPNPSAPTTYYVTIADPGQLGDTGTATTLPSYAETTQAKVGQPGYTYIGSIVALPGGGGTTQGGGGLPPNVPTIPVSGGGGGAAITETPGDTMNGTNVTFTLSYTPTTGSLTVWLNGVEQVPTTDYTLSGTTITFVVAPKSTDLMIAEYTH